jgi:hypothetical protein
MLAAGCQPAIRFSVSSAEQRRNILRFGRPQSHDTVGDEPVNLIQRTRRRRKYQNTWSHSRTKSHARTAGWWVVHNDGPRAVSQTFLIGDHGSRSKSRQRAGFGTDCQVVPQ